MQTWRLCSWWWGTRGGVRFIRGRGGIRLVRKKEVVIRRRGVVRFIWRRSGVKVIRGRSGVRFIFRRGAVGVVRRRSGVSCVIIERILVLVVMYRVQACAGDADGGDQQQSLHCHLRV